MRHRFPVVVTVVGFSLVWIHPVFAFANMINNGSFETPVLSQSLQYQTILPGAEPTGFSWRVSSGNVDITVNGAFGVFVSFDGLQFLDLDGTVPGAIAQSFATTPGNAYVLNFVYANNFGIGGTIPARGTVRVLDTSSGTNLIAPLSLTHSSSAAGDARWTPSGAIRFVAQGASTTLSFTSNDAGGSGGLFLDAVSVEPVTQPADRIVLSEDFEDGVLDPRISVQTTGTFSAGPGIKNVTNFGSTKAFGFGLSTCGASCFFSFATTFRITFLVPEFIVSISFKEMELFSNWGSGGGVFIDGQPFGAECALPACGTYSDFGRLPNDDLQPDTTFRSRLFPINRTVTTIELRVNNISNRSEIYIDDLVIAGLPVPFSFVDRGGVSLSSSGSSLATTVGHAIIQPNSGSTTPSGLAIFGFRQNGVLVTEAGVPASPQLQFGRIYAEVNGPVNTGLAIANPNSQPATISFFFTGPNGNFGGGVTTIPANGQIAKFLNESPFNAGSSVSGTFTFTSSVPVAVVALRGLTNERGDFLVTTLPVADLSSPAASGTLIFPQFADGGGWTTQVVLVNPGDSLLTGTVQFLNPSGGTSTVVVNGQANSSFAYSIPPRTSQKLQTSGLEISTQSGSVRAIPDFGNTAPSGLAIFSFRNRGITVTEAGVPAVPAGTAFRLYAEVTGTLSLPGSIQTGLAVTNTSASAATVMLEVHRLDGSFTGLTGTLSVPANGRVAMFLNEIQGFASLQTPFQGILRISSASLISVLGLRGRYNERGDFLITTTPASNEAATPSTVRLFFPHIVDGGGYTTQFVLFSGQAGQSSSATMQLFSQSGETLSLTLR